MALPTIGYQVRNQGQTQDGPSYRIETVVTAKGDLPDIHLFLLRINDRARAAADTLERVCSVADFTDYQPDRLTAALQGQTFYRVSAMVVTYTAIDVAIAARDLISEQITALALSYRTYVDDFSTAGFSQSRQPYNWPAFDKTLRARLVETYCAARALSRAQADVVTALQAAISTSGARITELQADLTDLQSVRSQQSASLTQLQSVQSTQTATLNAMQLYLAEVSAGLAAYVEPNGADAYFGAAGTVTAQQSTREAQVVAAQAQLSALTAVIAQLQAALTTLDASVSAKQAAIATETAARAGQQQDLDLALSTQATYGAAEGSALADVLQVDPTFDSETDCCCA
jgi:hypothetical protein